jgi:PTH1 family peptidyl-tRNA hydrolase
MLADFLLRLGLPMWMIVGLGNPGFEYAWTPHNLGFLVIDRLAERAGIRVERPEAKSYIGKGKIAGHEAVLAKPQTYMNLSGMAVRDLLERVGGTPAETIVVVDEVALPWGNIRLRERGSAGGHNGLKSIIGALGTDEFIRLRLGTQPDRPVGDLAAYVLHPMRRAEMEAASEVVEMAADAVECALSSGVKVAMARYNRRATPPQDSEEQ